MASKALHQQVLSEEDETSESLEIWKNSLIQALTAEEIFAPFLRPDTTWPKKRNAVASRGFTGTGAANKAAVLDLMLCHIANCAPVIARSTIVKQSTSLGSIWEAIRCHYGVESNDSKVGQCSTSPVAMVHVSTRPQPRQTSTPEGPSCKAARIPNFDHCQTECSFIPDSDNGFRLKAHTRSMHSIKADALTTKFDEESDELAGDDSDYKPVVKSDDDDCQSEPEFCGRPPALLQYDQTLHPPLSQVGRCAHAYSLLTAAAATPWSGDYLEVMVPDVLSLDQAFVMEPRQTMQHDNWRPTVTDSLIANTFPDQYSTHEVDHLKHVVPGDGEEVYTIPTVRPPSASRTWSRDVCLDPDTTHSSEHSSSNRIVKPHDVLCDLRDRGDNEVIDMGSVFPPTTMGHSPRHGTDKMDKVQGVFDRCTSPPTNELVRDRSRLLKKQAQATEYVHCQQFWVLILPSYLHRFSCHEVTSLQETVAKVACRQMHDSRFLALPGDSVT